MQTDFVSKRIFGPKNFGPKKILGQKFLGLEKMWIQKNFGPREFLRSEIFCQKVLELEFWVQNDFRSTETMTNVTGTNVAWSNFLKTVAN